MTRVAVVGGGAVGLTAAHDLAAAGVDVTLYEAGSLGSGATRRAAGIVYDAFAEDVEAALAARALERFRSLDAAGADLGLHAAPYVWFAPTEDGEGASPSELAAAIRRDAERMAAHGRAVEVVDADWLRARYPQVRTDDVAVAAVAHDAAVADPEAYVAVVAERARDQGVTIREQRPVSVRGDPPRVLVDGGPGAVTGGTGDAGSPDRFDAVVVAAGAGTAPLLADAGHPLPLATYRTQALRADGPAVPSLYDAASGLTCRPHRRGLIASLERASTVVDAPPDPSGTGAAPVDDAIEAATVAALEDRLVNYTGSVDESWAGHCTATADGHPLLGPVGGGLHVAAGWDGHGFMLAPATGEAIAEQVLGADATPAFDPRRFDGSETVSLRHGVELPGDGTD